MKHFRSPLHMTARPRPAGGTTPLHLALCTLRPTPMMQEIQAHTMRQTHTKSRPIMPERLSLYTHITQAC